MFITPLLKGQSDTVSGKISKIPHKHVDVLAKFPQGDFKTYISRSLQINHQFQNSVKGEIVLLMSIDADGSTSHVSILKSLSPQIDPEIVRVINASPKWQPAILNGQKVSMDMVLNIDIAIDGSKPSGSKPNPIIPVPPGVIFAGAQKPATKGATPPIVTKAVLPPIKKAAQPVFKKPVPILAKKAEAPKPVKKVAPLLVVKNTTPPMAKKIVPPAIKKPVPPVVKKAAPLAKKTSPPIVKKVEPPVVKKPLPAIAKKIERPVVKKAIPVVKEPQLVKQSEPIVIKKPKRKIPRGDLFNPTSGQPVFPGGGFPGLVRYLGASIVYPEGSKKANIEGKVILTFVVEADGSVNDVEVVSSPAEDLSQEAIRVLLASPKWKPAEQNGIKVPMAFTIPIKFTLQDKQTN